MPGSRECIVIDDRGDDTTAILLEMPEDVLAGAGPVGDPAPMIALSRVAQDPCVDPLIPTIQEMWAEDVLDEFFLGWALDLDKQPWARHD
jgi:hypothetical protein